MPQPEGSMLGHNYSPILTRMAVNFLPKNTDFIARTVFPNVPVGSPTGSYNVWNRGDFLRRGGKKISNYEAPPIEGFASGTGTYSVSNWGVSTAYTARELAEARRGGTNAAMLKQAKLQFVVTKGLLELEVNTATLCQTAGNWTTTYAGVVSGPTAGQFIQWDQAASSPIDDVLKWKEAMRLLTGFAPNAMIIPQQVWLVIRRNLQIIDRIKYGGTMDRPTEITMTQLKALFEIDNILIPVATYNTAKEGQADVFDYIWGKTMWLGYIAGTPGRETPSAGYHFSWVGDTTEGLPDGVTADGEGPAQFGAVQNEDGLFIRTYQENRPAARFIDSELWTTPNVVAAGLGITLTAPIA